MTTSAYSYPFIKNPHLPGSSFNLLGGKSGVLLIHGFTATTAEVRPFAHLLNQTGYTISAPLLPGHGTTPEDMNRCKWQDWARAAEEALTVLSGKCEQVFIAGESMGALLALYLASQHPAVRGLAIFAPALIVPGLRRARYVAPFIKYRTKSGADKDDGLPWQGYMVTPLRAAVQLYAFQKTVKSLLPSISIPAIIIQGCLDRTIDPRSSEMVYDLINSQQKELHWLEKSTHCIILDKELEQAAKLTLSFLKRAENLQQNSSHKE